MILLRSRAWREVRRWLPAGVLITSTWKVLLSLSPDFTCTNQVCVFCSGLPPVSSYFSDLPAPFLLFPHEEHTSIPRSLSSWNLKSWPRWFQTKFPLSPAERSSLTRCTQVPCKTTRGITRHLPCICSRPSSLEMEGQVVLYREFPANHGAPHSLASFWKRQEILRS